VIYFGSTTPAMHEALEMLRAQGGDLNGLRLRGFPFCDEVFGFVAEHERVFVVEQNRDAQLRSLLINEGGVDPAKLVPILHYDGAPITARFIAATIADRMGLRTRVTEAAE
jgi:2-oxoglutarate ferredoxin oxidoreductase subunit alpha